HGLAPNDVVATTEPTTDDLAITFLACCRADLTFVALSSKLAPVESARLLERVGAALLLTADGSPHPANPMEPTLRLDLPGMASRAADTEVARRFAFGTAEAVAILQTTSGTTGGMPKIARTPHRLLTWRRATPSWWESDDDVFYIAQPSLFMVRGFCEMLSLGSTIVLSDATSPARMEAEMAAHRVTTLRTIPAIIGVLTEQRNPCPDGLILRVVRAGAAPFPPMLHAAAERRYHAMVVQEYASTEGGSMLGTPRDGAPAGSIGKPQAGVDARIVDEDGVDVPEGATGELLIRSPGLTLGYLDNPVATARTLRDGWLWTGDLARRDADGFYYLEGRRALRINVAGFEVAPEEVEAVLEQHPGVREAVVLAMPDAVRGEVVRAVIVPEGAPPSTGELRHYCRARLTGYKVPRHWEFRDELPRSPLGKVLRHKL
ncbi:MAG: AMP-binding protein, partial [Chloroflexota bacterium]|nr:AMP-binding protein [Chloroflexota bacterium]